MSSKAVKPRKLRLALNDTNTPLPDTTSDTVNAEQPERLANVASSYKETLFKYYCGQLFNHGVLKCRYKDECKQIAVMNDYDSESGDFKVF